MLLVTILCQFYGRRNDNRPGAIDINRQQQRRRDGDIRRNLAFQENRRREAPPEDQQTPYNSLPTHYNSQETPYNSLPTQYNYPQSQYNNLQSQYNNLPTQYNNVPSQYNTGVETPYNDPPSPKSSKMSPYHFVDNFAIPDMPDYSHMGTHGLKNPGVEEALTVIYGKHRSKLEDVGST